jgi:adenylate cyclase
LVRELEHNPDLLEGREQDVTILVRDLRGFATVSERLGARKTCQLIRDMMERLSKWILEYGGVIVDYAGDGILAMWNAPVQTPDHPQRACRAALAMKNELPASTPSGAILSAARWPWESASTRASPRLATLAAAASSSTAHMVIR